MRAAMTIWGLAAGLLLGGCSAHRVTPEQAKKMVEGGARLLDVRSVEEFDSGHLDGALNIPVDELEKRLSELEPKGQGVVVYCRSGMRSARAAKTLAAAGFSEVGDLGGMSNWPR